MRRSFLTRLKFTHKLTLNNPLRPGIQMSTFRWLRIKLIRMNEHEGFLEQQVHKLSRGSLNG